MFYCVTRICASYFSSKQKTADEMRISDWSSDVCSSDLTAAHRPLFRCQPIKRIVMKDKGHAVTAHLHVTFHAMPRPDCSVKGRAAVFYHPVTVQATMREGLRSQKGDAPGIG